MLGLIILLIQIRDKSDNYNKIDYSDIDYKPPKYKVKRQYNPLEPIYDVNYIDGF